MTTPTPERAAQHQSRGEHTTGPWELGLSNQDNTGQSILSGDKVIALTVTDDAVEESTEEQANARLIAAAPELLAACKAWELARKDGGISHADFYEAAWKLTQTAIRKAEQPQ